MIWSMIHIQIIRPIYINLLRRVRHRGTLTDTLAIRIWNTALREALDLHTKLTTGQAMKTTTL